MGPVSCKQGLHCQNCNVLIDNFTGIVGYITPKGQHKKTCALICPVLLCLMPNDLFIKGKVVALIGLIDNYWFYSYVIVVKSAVI